MAIYINQDLNATGDISGDWAIFGNGSGDSVQAGVDVTQNIINFGNGAGDFVSTQTGDISSNAITFGNGAGDYILAGINANNDTSGNITNDIISFGGGAGDSVSANNSLSSSIVTFGDGSDGSVNASSINHCVITFLDDKSQSENSVGWGPSLSNSTITFGNGDGDTAIDALRPTGSISNNTIIFGKGDGDQLLSPFDASSNNKIILGNGQGDRVLLGTSAGLNSGGDYVATGTGAGDIVRVGAHTNADTFAFTFGTSGANFTTVTGAAAGDHVVVNGGQLGNALSSLSGATADTTLASYISSLGTLTKGDTYVGLTPTSVDATFIVTDSSSGQIGAIELTGLHTASISNHALTLLT